MRVFTATLATETNTFAPMPTGLASFQQEGYFPAGTHPNQMTFFAGPLWAARQRAPVRGWTVIEGLVAMAQPSGITTRAAYEALRDELLADLRAALPVQMVVLGLHGAMVADGYPDCEGDLLTRVRAIVGPEVVVGAELDPHHHLTEAMVSQADLLIAFKQ
ncbi:MAG: microcystin LR degradation protein MlrC-like protein, partial [Burkholderiales bacterium PBB5]